MTFIYILSHKKNKRKYLINNKSHQPELNNIYITIDNIHLKTEGNLKYC